MSPGRFFDRPEVTEDLLVAPSHPDIWDDQRFRLQNVVKLVGCNKVQGDFARSPGTLLRRSNTVGTSGQKMGLAGMNPVRKIGRSIARDGGVGREGDHYCSVLTAMSNLIR